MNEEIESKTGRLKEKMILREAGMHGANLFLKQIWIPSMAYEDS